MSHYRLNLFIQPEHAKRLDELAAKKGVSKSSIVAAALASWLSPDAADQREALGLSAEASVLLISTEGDTVPHIYRSIVWQGAHADEEYA